MSAETERAILACILFDPSCILLARDQITPDTFSISLHQRIYAAMLACADDRQAPDLTSVTDRLGRDGVLASDVADLLLEPVTTTYLPQYLDNLRRAHRQRTVVHACTEIIRRVQTEPDVDVAALIAAILRDLPADDQRSGLRAFGEMAPSLRERFAAQLAGTWTERVVPTGFPTLDRALGGGFRPGELVILAARPGMGKTALGMAMTLAAARVNPALTFSLEMPMVSLVERALADTGSVSMADVRAKQISRLQYNALLRALDRIKDLPVWVDDTSGLTTDQALARVQRFQMERPVSLVMADYLEIMGDRNDKSEERRVGEISKRMKNLARSCDVPALLLCQLSREVEKRPQPIPVLSDLRYSGSIEADADVVLMLYRHDYYVAQSKVKEDAGLAGTCDVLIRKQRNGPEGKVTMRFKPETMSFLDPTEADDPWR